MREVEEEYRRKTEELREQLTENTGNILLGEKIPLDVVNSETGGSHYSRQSQNHQNAAAQTGAGL